MRKMRLFAPITALLMMAACAFTLAGCKDMLSDEPEDGANANGFGTVRVSVSLGAARTAMPTPTLADFARVEYWFAKDGAAAVEKTAVDDVFTLEAGNYTLTVKAYVAETDESPAAEGASSSFTVTVGQAATAAVTMRPIVSEGNGSLSFSISYPATATVETFTLTQLAGDNPITLTGTPTTVSGTTTLSGNATVASGYYILQITLTKTDNTSAGMREAVHIYQNLSTAFSYTFADAEFIPVPTLTLITTVAELTAYLETLPIGSATDPTTTVPLALAFNTGTVQAGQIAWADINTAIQNSAKYVTLDLSASTAAYGTTANTIAGDFFMLSGNGNAFNIIKNNTHIKGIILPGGLTSIGDYAFSGCSGLTSVTIGEGVTSIGDYAFSGCSGLTSVTIEEGVTSIGNATFIDCSGLTNVTIPGNVTSIGNGAFSGCSGLTAFTVAESNTAYSAQDGILYNKDKTTIIRVPPTKSGALNLPNTLISIGRDAFFYCSGLSSVTIGEGVTSIGQCAFEFCSGLTSVTIPGGVTTIEQGTFWGCDGLTSVTIPGSVTTIGSSAFNACSRLTRVIFGAGSNITMAWDNNAFSSSYDVGSISGTNLWTAYTAGTKAGTYTRDGTIWTQIATGEGSVTLTFWVNEDDQILASNSSVTISKTSAGGYNASFTATVSSGYGTVSWSVSGVSKSGNESIEIVAADYPTGTYRLRVIVSKDGMPYSTEITFTVLD